MRYTDTWLASLDHAQDVRGIEGLRGASVLVTGASGLIGSCVADCLLRLNETRDLGISLTLAARNEDALVERFAHWPQGSWRFQHYDALEPLEFSGPFDYIVHCASNAHPAAYVAQPVETLMANVTGTHNMLELARRNPSCRLLYISSSEVYGRKDEPVPYQEDEYLYVDILDPRSCYPSSKRAAETLCAAFAAEHGVDFVVARPGHVYGPCITPRDSRAHAQFARDAAAGRDIVMKSAGNQLRSYCYVVDCATALLSILVSGKSGTAYNVSNPNSVVTIRELAEAFAAAGGAQVVFDLPSDAEAAGYNRMTCSALSSERLEGLGWQGAFDLAAGAAATLDAI